MTDGPAEILLEEEIPEKEMISEYLSDAWGRSVSIHVPMRGEKKAVLDMALKDAKVMEDQIKAKESSRKERDEKLSSEIADVLKRAGYPAGDHQYRVEAYDISNTNGVDTVGGMVVFEGMKKDKKSYRRFKVRTVDGPDDYSSMKEVIYRRIKRLQDGDSSFSERPDILLIDGGRGHIGAVCEVLTAMREDIPVLGMVKDDSHRTRGLVFIKDGDFHEIPLKGKPLLFKYLGTIQEEVHRFSIDYNRGLRDKGKLHSVLDEIEGIGAVRRNALLSHFGSVEKIKAASSEELAAAPNMNKRAADAVYKKFHG